MKKRENTGEFACYSVYGEALVKIYPGNSHRDRLTDETRRQSTEINGGRA